MVISLLRLIVQGIKIIKSPGVEGSPVLRLGELKWNVGASQQLFGCDEAITLGEFAWSWLGMCLTTLEWNLNEGICLGIDGGVCEVFKLGDVG